MKNIATSLLSPLSSSLETDDPEQFRELQAGQPSLSALQESLLLPPEESETPESSDAISEPKSVGLKIFISTFLTIFLAELGDKTQLTTLLMSAESHKPWIVFAGAGTALVATSLIGVWLGCWLAKRVPPKTLETAAGCLLLLVAGQLVWDIIHI